MLQNISTLAEFPSISVRRGILLGRFPRSLVLFLQDYCLHIIKLIVKETVNKFTFTGTVSHCFWTECLNCDMWNGNETS
jgi:hypothetical protein